MGDVPVAACVGERVPMSRAWLYPCFRGPATVEHAPVMTSAMHNLQLTQTPAPGCALLRNVGDCLTFSLRVSPPVAGTASLRTNLCHAAVRRREIIAHVESSRPILHHEWHDIPMSSKGEGLHEITLPLHEVGRFAAKALFLPSDGDEPLWPGGHNVHIKVEPADAVAGNAVYTAFVRQFHARFRSATPPDPHEAVMARLETDGYSVIPPSGTFRELIAQLGHIIDTMGFRVIQLLPIFPCPTTYARMGRFGSPFAALDYMDVDPSLADFDRKTTPLDQFRELVDAVHFRDGRLFLDVPINHTGWASWLQIHHPEWFVREQDRSFRSPGAWGVTWQDLSELDYRHRALWRYMADVFLFWCRQGVDGFRCDAGYMVPFPVWEYIVAKVRNAYPETVFLLEGLGGSMDTTESLLADAGLNWAYSELFQCGDRQQVEQCLGHAVRVSASKGIMVHYAETHDNNRLAATSPEYARMRTALAALCSHNGIYGITGGVEWFATEKVDVHGAPPLRWGQEPNQVAELTRINAILSSHPAFGPNATLRLLDIGGNESAIALRRVDESGRRPLLAFINLDTGQPTTVRWPASVASLGDSAVDLLTEHPREPDHGAGDHHLRLAPGEVLCLARADDALASGTVEKMSPEHARHRRNRHRARGKVVELCRALGAGMPTDSISLAEDADRLLRNPEGFAAEWAPSGDYAPVVAWSWPRDLTRVVMAPPRHILHLKSPFPFAVTLLRGDRAVRREHSLRSATGEHFVLFAPEPPPDQHERLGLEFQVFGPEACRRGRAELLRLAESRAPSVTIEAGRERIATEDLYGICTNGCGAISLVHASWGTLNSRYDALLAANLDPAVPVDRRVLLRRCRAWVVFRDYSHELGADCTETFSAPPDGNLYWRMRAPIGMGKTVALNIALSLGAGHNTVRLRIKRATSGDDRGSLVDEQAVRLILRPDLEDRGFHDVTKAFGGAESRWPSAVRAESDAFCFAPFESHTLRVALPGGRFVREDEWTYMVHHDAEAERGLEPHTDVFSPGYFECELTGGAEVELQATAEAAKATGANAPRDATEQPAAPAAERLSLERAAQHAIRGFVVKRDDSLTVIAGYPWFLDWGRDTLICLRGMIAAGMHRESLDILRQFARFEREGTLPNMIRGNDDSNRDTSDAPLWLFVACADLLAASRDTSALETDCGGRRLRDVLSSIAHHYIAGTPNGIVMDPESGLVFSPSHFTWMDTNHPAGTPREGYPIEIQALWYHAVSMMVSIAPEGHWQELRDRIADAILLHYSVADRDWLSDCLHASSPAGAAAARADDALRPNQLLAITLGAVSDKAMAARVVRSSAELLVPGAIRSLADRPVACPIAIHRDGALLNDPNRPYQGRYEGDEDTSRKPAYHNGTAWTWPFPSYAEALLKVHGPSVADTARAILSSSVELIEGGCVGHTPEILDGNAPHRERGCCAQAWGATELYRVLRLVESSAP